MPERMRQVVVPRWGIEHLEVVEAPVPEPGPGEALVRMRAASVNARDWQIVSGQFFPDQPLPIVPLSDGAGQVVALGPGVDGVAVGDPVSPLFFPDWRSGEALGGERARSTGLEAPGVLSEYGVFPAGALVRNPTGLDPAEAACLPCAGLTAWNSVATLAGLGPGDWLLVQGTGGVAIAALQFAVALGVRVIVTSSSAGRRERARTLGAAHTIDYRAVPEWGAAARELTGGRGVDAVIEVGGEGTLPQSLAALRRGGHVCVIGYLAGTGLGLDVFHLIERNAHLHGLSVGNREQHEAMLAFVARHDIHPVISGRYALEDAGRALAELQRGGVFGKLVIDL